MERCRNGVESLGDISKTVGYLRRLHSCIRVGTAGFDTRLQNYLLKLRQRVLLPIQGGCC